MSHDNTRAVISQRLVTLAASGDRLSFERDGMHFLARSGATTTACTCPAYTALPVGLRFTLDNSNGSGSLTLTPVSGTPTVVAATKVYEFLVAANGSLRAGELAAAPT